MAGCAGRRDGFVRHGRGSSRRGRQRTSGARAAATEGAKAFDEKRYADAADLFSRAESVVHSPVHLLYIARSQAGLGALVKAQETYRKLAREDLSANAPPAFRKAVEDGNRELKELEPRLPYVTVTVPGRSDAVVEMDGKRVAPALVGVPLPVDRARTSSGRPPRA